MHPPRHFTNAVIHVGDAAGTVARTLTIAGGRVVALDAPAPPDAVVTDLGGAWIGPGFIDAHLHLTLGATALLQPDLSACASRDAFEAVIAAAHDALPAGAWLVAAGWDETAWGGELPTRDWLAAAAERPVVAYRGDLHAAVVNDAVLAQIDVETPLAGGHVVRAADDGAPTGVLVEAALWERVNPIVPPPEPERLRSAVLEAQRRAHAAGLTTVGTMEYVRDVDAVLEPLRDQLTLRTRITLLDRPWPPDLTLADARRGDARLGVIGFKAFLDGTLGSRTARLLEPYADAPGQRGLWVEHAAADDDRLAAWIARVAGAGWQPAMHAIGDAAVRRALDAIETLDDATRHAVRPRIEHAQQIDGADLARCAGQWLSMQPLHRATDARIAAARLGAARLGGSFPFRTLAAHGARLAFGSDWPVVSFDPLAAIHAAVTGAALDGTPFVPEEALDLDAALTAATRGAAQTLHLDDVGALTPGAPADLVVLDRAPAAVDWTRERPRVVETVAAGATVFRADDIDGASGENAA